MSTILTKRPAGDAGESRPTKRHMSSSPEEGELDDATPPPSASMSGRTPPTAASAAKLPSKVPFPFKKKALPPNAGPSLDDPKARHSYTRPGDDNRRHRDDDIWRHGNGRMPRMDGRSVRPPDHWALSHDLRGPRPPRRDSYDDRYADDRPYRPYTEVNNWEPRRAHNLVSPPPMRRTRSPSTPHSRSPSSSGSPGKEKHRLPRPSVADVDPRGGYDSDRGRDDSGRDYKRDKWQNNSPVSSLPGGEDKYHKARDTWSRRDHSSESLRRSEILDVSRRDTDHYAPTSPRTPPRPPSPQSLREGPQTPPPPLPDSLPPRPKLEERPTFLPSAHAAVKISLPKKPPTPKEKAFPISLLSARENRPQESDRSEDIKPTEAVKASTKTRRKPTPRTRDEEKAAYGRVFQGCGQQSDYEVINKLGEGTFGEVHKAFRKADGQAVALKRILMHNEREGMPVTALREIKILKSLDHPCIVEIFDMFVVRSRGKEAPLSVYMVFPYMDHDLAGLLENERVKLVPSQIKLYMKQLLEGTEYMHRNHILHRDMKAANLLISNTGSLKIADFGLARAFDPNIVRSGESRDGQPGKERKYTNCVVTRWYRPPELLLGARQYGGEVDMWGIGCVLAEMFVRKPILPGASDFDQLERIWQLCGTPTQITWPNFDTLPGCDGVKRFAMHPRKVKQTYDQYGAETCDLIDKLLTCNPRDRIMASQALDHDYFWTDPLPADPRTLPAYEASHEFDKRGRRNQAHLGPPPAPLRPEPPSRPLPAPTQPPPLYFGRPQPSRESYRNGPPAYPQSYGLPSVPPYAPPPRLPPNTYHPLPPPPTTLPPIVMRPGQPLPPMYQGPIEHPAHLPPRPRLRGSGGERGHHPPRGREDIGDALNYG